MTQPYVKQRTENAISTIEFFHPAHNSLPGSDAGKTGGVHCARPVATTRRRSSSCKAVARGRFAPGPVLRSWPASPTPKAGRGFFAALRDVINAMRKCPKFIIARVQGKAVGGGVGLAAAVDYCMASQYAAIKLSELSLGLGPFVVGPAVERKLGLSAMSQLTIDADSFYDAEWARQKGLYVQVWDSIDALDAPFTNWRKKLAGCNPEAMRELKRIFWQGTEHWDELLAQRAAISGGLVLSAFTKEALKAFGSGRRTVSFRFAGLRRHCTPLNAGLK